jgi:hypothetical protein
MSELVGLEAQFQEFIMSGQAPIKDSIVSIGPVNVDTRLGIYRDAYKLRLVECLTANFTAVHLYLGTKEFGELCSSYIDAHPSTYRSVRWYGHRLAEFIEGYYKPDYHFVAELAHFEWAMTLAFDAVDDPILTVEDMAAVSPDDWAGLCFKLRASAQRLNYHWNTIPLWQTLVADEDIPKMLRNEEATPWLLWRTPDYLSKFYSLSAEEVWMLDAVQNNASFADLCEGLCQWVHEEEVAMRAASYLKSWIQKGILASIA